MSLFLGFQYKLFVSLALTFALLHSCSFALFDTGTVMGKGKLELDVCINPVEMIDYAQNYVFWHYGLGGSWETHGYASKWGYIGNWDSSQVYELYGGFVRQFYGSPHLDLATCVGLRKALVPTTNFSIFGPSVLYTVKVAKNLSIAGHIMPIWDLPREGGSFAVKPLNRGYTTEIGAYFKLTEMVELAIGAFTTTASSTRPIYTLNFYLN